MKARHYSKFKPLTKMLVQYVFVLLAILLVVTGCGQGGNEGGGSQEDKQNQSSTVVDSSSQAANESPSKADEKPDNVTLRFSWWGGEGRHKPYLAAIEAYEKLNPHVKIEAEYQSFDGYQQKIFTQLASDSTPDIMQLSFEWFPELAKRSSMLIDFNQQEHVDLSGFNADFSKEYGEFDGKQIGLPLGTNTSTIVANKTLADKLGIDLTTDYSWDELIELGGKLNQQDPEFHLLNSDVNTLNIAATAILKQRTGDQVFNDDYTVSFTREDLIYAYDIIRRGLESGTFEPAGESQLFSGKTEQSPKWINQKTAFNMSYASSTLRFQATAPEGVELVTLRYPTIQDAKQGSSAVAPTFMVAVKSSSPYADEALKFVNWFVNDPDAAVVLGDSRSIPPTAVQQKAVLDAKVINSEIIKAVEWGMTTKMSNNNGVSTNPELTALMVAQMEKVAFMVNTPESIADETLKLLEDKLEQLKNSAQ